MASVLVTRQGPNETWHLFYLEWVSEHEAG